MKLVSAAAMGSLALASGAWADTVVDLTANSSSGTIHGAIFSNDDLHAAGSGVIDSFVRIGAANMDQVSGYNTSVASQQFGRQEIGGAFTHDIQLGDVPVLTVNGTAYYQFLLDINQENADPLLTLDDVQIYTNGASLSSYQSNLNQLGNLVFRMDGPGGNDNNRVELNYELESGSGWGDMSMLVPVANFNGAGADTFVYLYSHFGTPNNNNDGYEEWNLQTPTVIPLPSAALAGMATFGLFGGLRASRRRRA